MLVGNTSVICIQIGASYDNDWRRSFTYNRKRNGPKIEPCGTPYFNDPASKINIININKKLSVWEIGLKPFNYRCLETKILLLLRRTP